MLTPYSRCSARDPNQHPSPTNISLRRTIVKTQDQLELPFLRPHPFQHQPANSNLNVSVINNQDIKFSTAITPILSQALPSQDVTTHHGCPSTQH